MATDKSPANPLDSQICGLEVSRGSPGSETITCADAGKMTADESATHPLETQIRKELLSLNLDGLPGIRIKAEVREISISGLPLPNGSSSDAIPTLIHRICSVSRAATQPGNLTKIMICTVDEKIVIVSSPMSPKGVSPDADYKPPAELTLWYTRLPGELLAALLPDFQRLKVTAQIGLPSLRFSQQSYPNLTHFRFFLTDTNGIDGLEGNLLEFMSFCPYLEEVDLNYPGPKLKSRWKLPSLGCFCRCSTRKVTKYTAGKSVALPSLKSFTQTFRDRSLSGRTVPISLFNNLILPPNCNIALTDEDLHHKRSWDGSFPISLNHMSQYSHIKTVEISVRFADNGFDARVKATFSYSFHKVSLEKLVLREHRDPYKIVEQILDSLINHKRVDRSIETLRFEHYLDEPIDPAVVWSGRIVLQRRRSTLP